MKAGRITYITGNSNKAKQAQKYIGDKVDHKRLNLTEIQSLDSREIISHKAKEAYKHLQSPVLIEDVAFVIKALGNFPGPLIKWVEEAVGYDKVCKMLEPFDNREAFVEVTFGLYDGEALQTFVGRVEGTIANQPFIGGGFGFDSIFIPNGYEVTRSQLKEEDYDKTNHRRIALEKVEKFLKESDNLPGK